MRRVMVGKFGAVVLGALVFYLAVLLLSRPEPASPGFRQSRPSLKEVVVGGAGLESPDGPSGVGENSHARTDAAPPPDLGDLQPKVLNDVDTLKVMGRIDSMVAACMNRMSSAVDSDAYFLDYRTLTKATAARERLLQGKYLLISAISGLEETSDATHLALPISGRHVLFTFTRLGDPSVFAVIDECATAQQQDWDAEASAFNLRPVHVRLTAIARHKQALEHIQGLYDSLGDAALDIAGRRERWRELEPRLTELRRHLLPWYLVVPKDGDTVWARKSLGR
jgi:hypothetical protein